MSNAKRASSSKFSELTDSTALVLSVLLSDFLSTSLILELLSSMTFFITLIIACILGFALVAYIMGRKFYKAVRQFEKNEQLYRTRSAIILTSPHTMK